MDYQAWMTDVMGKLMKPTKTKFPENRASRRAEARSLRKRGKHFTK